MTSRKKPQPTGPQLYGFYSAKNAMDNEGYMIYLNSRGGTTRVTSVGADPTDPPECSTACVSEVKCALEGFRPTYFITPEGVDWCVQNQCSACVDRVREHHAEPERILAVLLARAAKKLKPELIRYLTQTGADTERADPNTAAPGEELPLINAIDRCDQLELQCTTVSALLEARARVDEFALNRRALTPLTLAAYRRNTALVRLLLGARADPNKPGMFNRTPLASAVIGEGADTTVELLLQFKADPNLDPGTGATLHAAVEGLSDATPSLIHLLVRLRADPNQKTAEGQTPLHVAAEYGEGCRQHDLGLVRALLESKADPQVEDAEGTTPLDRSIHGPAQEWCLVSKPGDGEYPGAAAEPIVDWMVRSGLTEFRSRRSPTDGRTLLDNALLWGYFDLVRYLVERGARCTSLAKYEGGGDLDPDCRLTRGALTYILHRKQLRCAKQVLRQIPGFFRVEPLISLCVEYGWPVPTWGNVRDSLLWLLFSPPPPPPWPPLLQNGFGVHLRILECFLEL